LSKHANGAYIITAVLGNCQHVVGLHDPVNKLTSVSQVGWVEKGGSVRVAPLGAFVYTFLTRVSEQAEPIKIV
jgi:hypothetical protein